ncbi:MAG TPA: hypothetical protein VGJ18_09065 [Gemmatimonadaceae bacterium]
MRSPLRRIPAWAVLSAAMIAACGPFHRGAQQESEILFHNQSIDEADVYAMGPGGDPIRIGTVDGQKTGRLRVPLISASDRVNIIARVFPSSRIIASGAFTLLPGGVMDITLPSEENMLAVLPARTQIGKQ